MSEMVWKDELIPGATRVSVPYEAGPGALPGTATPVLDTYGRWIYRNDWVIGDYGRPKISGSGDEPAGRTPGGDPIWIPTAATSTNTLSTGGEQVPLQVLTAQQGGTNPIATVLAPTAPVTVGEGGSQGSTSRRTIILLLLAGLAVLGIVLIARRGGVRAKSNR